ncbi:MAG: hypothetical protein JXA28_14505 [Bacteroidetes bacterium]|nr:hypothetical protein [Bacteroidota bacterium]
MRTFHAAWTACAVLLFQPLTVTAQSVDPSAPENVQDYDLVERLIDPATEEDVSTFIEEIEDLARQPLCLRGATPEELSSLPFLSSTESHALAAILQDAHAGWEDIARALADDEDRLLLLRHCCRLDCDRAAEISPFGGTFRSRFQQEAHPREGYLDGHYPGSRARLQERLQLRLPAGIEAGMIMEKDPGETSLTDHFAGAVSIRGDRILQRAVAGDFTVTAGQGLVFWQAFARAKSSEADRIGKAAPLLRPFVSATEGLAFRGVAAQMRLAGFDVLGLYSSRQIDATIDESTGTAGSFSIDGLHRTESEQRRRGTVREIATGGVVQWNTASKSHVLQMGASGVSSRFSVSSRSRSPFAFEGDAAWVAGLHARWSTPVFAIYAEAALSHTQVPALVAGAEILLSPRLHLALLYRRYHERFVSLHAAAFGERSGHPQNEEGMYTGLRFRPFKGLRIDAWCDVFRIPNRTYFLHLPSSGGELFLRAEYRFPGKTQLALQLRREHKDQTIAAVDDLGRDIRPLTMRMKMSGRMELQREFPDGLRIRLRADYARVAFDDYAPATDGAMLSAEVRLRPLHALTLVGKVTGYSTASYDARLYQFEHDVRGVMLNTVCYGEGMRAYLFCTLRLWGMMEVGARYALTLRDGARSFGSGDDAITGDRLGVLSLQLDAQF